MSPFAHVLTGLVRLYRLAVAPYLAGRCRFEPSCSSYALDALSDHGAARGAWLILRRLGRCHPLGGWGYDPVPPPGRGA
ncbi:MAG: membrane protein insertion efficiency factor YidD [Alphaproteobacteria bacterium]